MKKVMAVLVAGLCFFGTQVYAGNGDLIVDGKLGVGTPTPYAKLHIQGPGSVLSGTARAVVEIADDNAMAAGVGGAITFLGKYTAAGDFTYGGYIQAQKTNATDGDAGFDLAFGSRQNGYGTAEVMRINSVGNVGIGTSLPNNKLTIADVGGPTVRLTDSSSGVFSLINADSSGSLLFSADHGNYGVSSNIKFNVDTVEKMRITSTGNVGIGTITPNYTLDVAGYAHTTYGVWSGSDINLKQNLLPVADGLNKVLQLAGFSYEWKNDFYNETNSPEVSLLDSPESKAKALAKKNSKIPTGRHYGVIAQDIEKVLPEVVNIGADGIKAVAYNEIIPFLIEAIKEQQKRIDKLEKQISGNQ